jgi:hypothetical protein
MFAAFVLLQTPPAVTQPKPGSALRKATLQAVRERMAKDVKGEIVFLVDALRVQGDWAFAGLRPRRPSLKMIDWTGTIYAEQAREGLLDDGLYALLRLEPNEKGVKSWRVKEFDLGPTDVSWAGWPELHPGMPKALLPWPEGAIPPNS